jgi:hypothetical protein
MMSETASLSGRKAYTDKSGKSGRISPAIIEKYLSGIHYPAQKKDLLSNAEKNSAPENVRTFINKMPDKTYKSPIDITKEIGKIE